MSSIVAVQQKGRSELAIISGTIVDAASGSQAAARVIAECSDGTVLRTEYQRIPGIFAKGSFVLEVPPGPTSVTVQKGPAFHPRQFQVMALDGRPTQLEAVLEACIPYRVLGWVAGENHTHMTHGEAELRISFERAALMAAAEGLDYLVLGAAWNTDDPSPANLLRLAEAASSDELAVFIGNEAPKNYYQGHVATCLGHCWTVGGELTAGDPDLYREIMDLEAHDYESHKPPIANFELMALLRRAGGVICYSHPLRWWLGTWGGAGGYPLEHNRFMSNMAIELPYDTLAGPVYDGLDILMRESWDEAAQRLWFALLNQGYRIAGTTSGDTCFDRRAALGPGMKTRLYTWLRAPLSPGALAAAIRAGRNVVSTGPFLMLNMGGGDIGDTLPPYPAQRRVRIEAWSAGDPGERITRVELIRRGQVVEAWTPGDRHATLEVEVPTSAADWFIARCFGAEAGQVAVTNPIYVEGAEPPPPVEASVEVRVVDAVTGDSLPARVEQLEIVGRQALRLASYDLPIGYAELRIPLTHRLRASAAGYEPQTLSLLFDVDRVREWTLKLREGDLMRESILDELRRLLDRCRLTFHLSRT